MTADKQAHTSPVAPTGRNERADFLRGIAMLLVVLGHTVSGTVVEGESSLLWNIICSLQMPLFVLISGYITRYSRPITGRRDFANLLLRRTLSYLLPFGVWTFLVRGLICGEYKYLDLKWLLWNMDSGYWFLFSLWTISILFAVAQYLSHLIAKRDDSILSLFLTAGFYLLAMAFLAALAVFMGVSFLCIKLTLYYMPFFFAGYLFGKYQEKISGGKVLSLVQQIAVAFCLLLWVTILFRFDLYKINDDLGGILLRAVASLAGCAAVCGLCPYSPDGVFSVLCRGIKWVGVHSLEVYTLHYLVLSLCQAQSKPFFWTLEGALLILANYVITLTLCTVIIAFVNRNRWLRFALFAKK